MARITEIARQLFDALESEKDWDGCRPYCTPEAGFATQSERMGNVPTLREYAEVCARFLRIRPDAHYVVRSFATDEERNNVCVYDPRRSRPDRSFPAQLQPSSFIAHPGFQIFVM
jgi:hypothetical protein